MSNVRYPARRPSDIAAITRIYADAVEHGTASFEFEPPDEAEMARRQQALLIGGYPYLVAERDDAVAGYAYAGPYRARPAYRLTRRKIRSISRPNFSARASASRLLGRLIAEAETLGFRQMIAVIGDSAQAASIGVHERSWFYADRHDALSRIQAR